MKIICIDFETANPFWGSICAAGVVVLDDGVITEKFSTLIKPHIKYAEFNRDNIRVHGIKPEMVLRQPEFPEFYHRIKILVEGGLIAAHNSTFDIDCLRDALTIYGLPIPSFEYICTCEIAKKMWKELKGFTLKKVSDFLGYKFRHHDALEDSLAAANILQKAMETAGTTDIRAIADLLGVKIRKVDNAAPYELSSVRHARNREDRISVREIKAVTREFDKNHPFYAKEMVFTGRFKNGLTRRQIMQMAADMGAVLCDYVRSKTDILVSGEPKGETESSKLRKAKKMAEEGHKIQIIGEDEFINKCRVLGVKDKDK